MSKPLLGTPFGRVIPRHAMAQIMAALADTRVVLLNGARQSGKSTLLRLVAAGRQDVTYRNLDEPAVLAFAREDPTAFVEHEGLMIIDEIQRASELLLPIKADVDAYYRPGRFLLSGSARVLGLRALPDALPGRMEVHELWPLSQGELFDTSDGFVDAAFRHGPDVTHDSDLKRVDIAERVERGGFAEAVSRGSERRRRAFFRSYIQTLIERDVMALSEIHRIAELRTIVGLLAARVGQMFVLSGVASQVGLPAPTVARYVSLLEETFLVKRIPAWSRNAGTRAVATPKLLFVDSGIAAALLSQNATTLVEPGNAAFGALVENFVLSELLRQTTWCDEEVQVYHYRTRDKVEVDAVLENARGQVVGVEVKATATARPEDFRGLRHLADRLGDDFLAGFLLYAGRQTLRIGEKFRAVPLSVVWEVRA